MEKKDIKYLIEELVNQALLEHRDELAQDYVDHIEKKFPELHADLVKLAKFSVGSVRGGYSPTKKLQQLSGLLKTDPDLDPRTSGDTHGVRLYIDHFVDDNKLAGQAKRWYQSTLDQMLKKYYTAPRKKRERKFKKYLQKNKSDLVTSADKKTSNESLLRLIDDVITENFGALLEMVRRPFNMNVPEDIKQLSQIFTSHGHELFVVGGAVRDALLGKKPKDYDVATDAKPDKILDMLQQLPGYRTTEVGKAFGVINVITPEGNEYEIATFREDIGAGRRPDSVEFTTIEKDVKRRDLTINALFYDINKQEVVDLVGGISDLESGVIKTVGDPQERFGEDRLRILRALRFATRMGVGLEETTENAILSNNSLEGVSPERIRDEFLKSIKSAKSVIALYGLYDTFDLWAQILPGLQINKQYQEIKNLPIQLALLTRDNNPKFLAKKLNELKYSAVETRDIVFLNLFQNLTIENAYHLKKLWKPTKISPEDLREFSNLSGRPDDKLVDAFIQYEPTVSGQELMDLGFKGREIGQEMERREAELFASLLK